MQASPAPPIHLSPYLDIPITVEECRYLESALGLLLALYAFSSVARILRETPAQSTFGRVLGEPYEPVTYKLSDFVPYTSAPILAHDEPLFLSQAELELAINWPGPVWCAEAQVMGAAADARKAELEAEWVARESRKAGFEAESAAKEARQKEFESTISTILDLSGIFTLNEIKVTPPTIEAAMPTEAKASVWEPNPKELNEHFADFNFWEECCALRDEVKRLKALVSNGSDAGEFCEAAASDLAKSYVMRLSTKRVALRGWDFRANGLGRFANWCEECRVCYAKDSLDKEGNTVKHHSCKQSRVEKHIAADLLAAKREAGKQRRLAALAAQNLCYSPDEFDRKILVSRGSVTAEALKKFDLNLSRKGNKYRIQ